MGQVVASNNPAYPVGSLVTGLTGWQDYCVASDAMPLMPIPPEFQADPQRPSACWA